MSAHLTTKELDELSRTAEVFAGLPIGNDLRILVEEVRRLRALADDPEAVERAARAARIEEVRRASSNALARVAANAWDSGEVNQEITVKYRRLARATLLAALNPQEDDPSPYSS